MINRQSPVMVTGATGYVAGRIVKKLLDEGFTVHATVRDAQNAEKLKYLNRLQENAPGKIRFFTADLLDDGSYAEAMQGCELVFHTASPFKINVKDPQKELVEPAKLGTRNVLEQANRTPTVKRVVVTGSIVAISGDNADIKNTPNGMFTEDIWNTSSSIDHQPYPYSKTLAEKEAWEIQGRQHRWDLVMLNPSMVIGPGINPFATSESFSIVKLFGDGTMRFGGSHWGMGVVDVRDLAEAHFKAGFTPEAAGRYIVSGHNSDFMEMAAALLPVYGKDFPIPRWALPKWLVWLFFPIMVKSTTRKMIARNVNIPWIGDNSRGVRELGLAYRPLQESMVEHFQQIVDHGLLRKN
ncbi:MAG: NAD-dependent epimerase/dehydratase family protein [Chlorobiaceae bacterium]|nr:NAD-dependent epimerase/dehydratase family protein [Chlorobiaceae bacterium]